MKNKNYYGLLTPHSLFIKVDSKQATLVVQGFLPYGVRYQASIDIVSTPQEAIDMLIEDFYNWCEAPVEIVEGKVIDNSRGI